MSGSHQGPHDQGLPVNNTSERLEDQGAFNLLIVRQAITSSTVSLGKEY